MFSNYLGVVMGVTIIPLCGTEFDIHVGKLSLFLWNHEGIMG